MKSYILTAAILFTCVGFSRAQKADSVVIRVGEGSKVIFSIKDKRDLETLKHYNFQALMDDMVKKLEQRDSSTLTKSSTEYLKDTTSQVTSTSTTEEDWDSNRSDNNRDDSDDSQYIDNDHRQYYSNSNGRRSYRKRTYSAFTIDIGTNNYLENGKFPDGNNSPYTVRPWGSWYVGLNSLWRTRVAGKFFIEWGGGVSWYNFKFNNNKILMTKDDVGVSFTEDVRDLDFRKSKLTATYVNLSLIPMLDFGNNSRKASLFNGYHSRSFRIGVGPYAGYRIDSYTKQMYFENGDKRRPKDHDNFYLNNLRYGMRLQLGFRSTDIFFNYDMNELFADGRGPKLNAFSFGITL
ncbi:MAG: hypothetical protein K2U26_04050 [Cyclobacteriaceae bacterium]|nr:hypothetical protein [Cyclobacteriaceae bacterium]